MLGLRATQTMKNAISGCQYTFALKKNETATITTEFFGARWEHSMNLRDAGNVDLWGCDSASQDAREIVLVVGVNDPDPCLFGIHASYKAGTPPSPQLPLLDTPLKVVQVDDEKRTVLTFDSGRAAGLCRVQIAISTK